MASTRISHPKGARAILGRLKRMYGAVPKKFTEIDAAEQIILAILSHNEPLSKAQTILQRLKSYYVDFNELRVTSPAELAGHMGAGFVQATAKARKILSVLRGVFDRENSFDLNILKSKSKQDLEEYFSSVQGSDNYLLASLVLYWCGRQAFPLDDKMFEACKELQLAKGPVDLEGMQAYLERQLRSSESYAFCQLLKKYSEKEAARSVKKKKTAKKKATSKTKKAQTKKKKKTTKKTTKKKRARSKYAK